MSRHQWRNQYTELEASKFHNKVREIFATDSYWSLMSCWQEVNVRDLIPDYPQHNHHFDWYIEELNTVVELHGRQHYGVVNYGNIGYNDAEREYFRIRDRDNQKKTEAIKAGFEYREIPYTEYKKLTADRLKELIFYG